MQYMAKKALPLRIDEGLLGRVDAARGDVSRTRWVERALEAALSRPVHSREESAAAEAEVLAKSRKAEGIWTQAEVIESFTAVESSSKPVPGVRRASSLVRNPEKMAAQARVNADRLRKAKGS
jgi:hypothetical protein